MAVENISRSISTKVWDRARIELAPHGSAVRHVTDSATPTDQTSDSGVMSLILFLSNTGIDHEILMVILASKSPLSFLLLYISFYLLNKICQPICMKIQ